MSDSLQDRLNRCPDGGSISLRRTEEILGPITMFPGDLVLRTSRALRRVIITGQPAVDDISAPPLAYEDAYVSTYSVGSIVAGYEVLGFVGVESGEEHYRVRNTRSELVEAMRMLPAGSGPGVSAAQRFVQARLGQARLVHPNIARIYTAFLFENRAITIMEFVEGQSLEARMRQGRPNPSDALAYAIQLLQALQYVHAEGIVHRGVQPSNILLNNRGIAKLTGFRGPSIEPGSPRVARDLGALHYMSPEQISGTSVLDGRSDLYSLGVVLYELTTGRRPFEAATEHDIVNAHQQQQPRLANQVDPAVSPELGRLIQRALAKEPAHRYPTAREVLAALEGVRSTVAPPPEPSGSDGNEPTSSGSSSPARQWGYGAD